jgi:hypothetical protein
VAGEDVRITSLPADPVVRRFVRGERLVTIPARRFKRRLVLDWLAQEFEPGRVYPEAVVNTVLGRHHPDYAALRRYMVDEGFMERRHGFYWRSGGTFNVG